MANDISVAIIGGGFAGISTAYELAKEGIESFIIEAGKIAIGNDEFPAGTLSIPTPPFSKWITHAFDTNYEEFSKLHGANGAKTFLEIMYKGTEIIKDRIKYRKPDILGETGSIVIAEDAQQNKSLQQEHERYRDLGVGIDYRRLTGEELNARLGLETTFSGGLFVPIGAMIDSRQYLAMLRQLASKKIEVCENTRITQIEESPEGVRIQAQSGESLTADNVVMATNGFYEDSNLRGLLEPRFTFMQNQENTGKNTSGCWTFGEEYFYLTRQDNKLVIGGCDIPADKVHFKVDEREPIARLRQWARKTMPGINPNQADCIHFGVYARTKDELPIVGKFDPSSRVSYIVGCNAIGHTTYNVAAELMPGILGYTDLTPEQKRFADFLNPRRKTLK